MLPEVDPAVQRVAREAAQGSADALPEVDPETDDRLLAILYEGWNSTCHTVQWAERAQALIETRDRELEPLGGSEKRYT